MSIGVIIWINLAWHILGTITCAIWGVFAGADCWELCNPYWYHTYYPVNWFGAIMGSLFYTILCPLDAVIYWFYKLCTVGRKK